VYTRIEPLSAFYIAEAYHQKYYLRNRKKLFNSKYFEQMSELDLINSTAATKLNGYAGGYGTVKQASAEIHTLGFQNDPEYEQIILDYVKKHARSSQDQEEIYGTGASSSCSSGTCKL